VKKEDVKLFTRIKKPFLEDDFFTTESEPESQEMEETTGSQAESESLSQSQVESDPNSESQSQSKTESTTFETSEVISQSNKSQVCDIFNYNWIKFVTKKELTQRCFVICFINNYLSLFFKLYV